MVFVMSICHIYIFFNGGHGFCDFWFLGNGIIWIILVIHATLATFYDRCQIFTVLTFRIRKILDNSHTRSLGAFCEVTGFRGFSL